jgi:Domain of unknown function (DUF4832)/Domain of unknown function (DUF4874)
MQLSASIRNRLVLLLAMVSLLTLVACTTNQPELPQDNPLDNPNDDTNTGNDSGSDTSGGNEPPATETQAVTVSYQKDTSDFLNPERGIVLNLISDSARPSPLTSWDFQNLRAAKSSVVHRFYNLSTFKNKAISQSFLDHIQADFNQIRSNGMKSNIRFSYNFIDGSVQDAPLSLVLSHIEQLRPVLTKNVDVIAFLDAGFIGRWGEWHSSTNGLTTVENKRKILDKLLAVLPKERAVAVRYAKDKKSIYGTEASLTEAVAFNGTSRSRTAHHNDCFVHSTDDAGTYIFPYDTTSLNRQKNYLGQDNLFLPQSGVTCGYQPPRSDCPQALADMQQVRWSVFARASDLTVVNRWQSQGCYSEIAKRLGYRFRLLDAVLPQEHVRGTAMTIKARMTNEGFANVYNPRKLELVIRNRATGAVTRYNINPGEDVRLYLPNPNETKTLTLTANISSTLAKGTYDLFLNLPDPTSSLYTRSAYSIRLANLNMWEASTGFNKLGSFIMR